MKKILISTSTFAQHSREPLDLLDRAGLAWELNPHGRKLDRTEAKALLAGKIGVIAGTEPLDEDVLAAAPDLRVISRVGTGMDNVDFDAAKARGIQVFNTPDGPTQAVAELTLAGMLTLLRHVALSDRQLRAGTWKKSMGRLLRGKTIAIVGLGRIGKALVRLLAPFEPTVLAVDPFEDADFAREHGIRYLPTEEALPACDLVTLHLGSLPEGGPFLDADTLALLPAHALVINCARGGLLDEAALAEALHKESLAGAYLDVFAQEPYSGPLSGLDNALLTPHIGSYAVECRVQMELDAVRNLIRALDTATDSTQ